MSDAQIGLLTATPIIIAFAGVVLVVNNSLTRLALSFGSLDGTRPGAIYFNLHDTANWPKWTVATTAYHEGVPGHHLQGSIANEAADIPTLFKLLN